MSSDWHMYTPQLCYPPYTTVGADSARFFYTVGGAILYCATPPYTPVGADAARFFYTVGGAIL